MQPEIIYIGDPMCSWCYGFSPAIQTLYQRHKTDVRMTLKMGGLHPGNDYVLNEDYKRFLLEHWTEIGERTGQKFSFGILDHLGWVYDTEKACRAVVAVRKLQPGSEFPYFASLQEGFYAFNRDPNDPYTFANAAVEIGIERDAFLNVYRSEEAKAETADDFDWARSRGVRGFPTVLLNGKRGLEVLTNGYQPLSALEVRLGKWLETSSN